MLRYLLLATLIGTVTTGCDVRTKDRIDGTAAANADTRQAPLPDPTTVQVIDSAYNFGKVTEGEVVEFSYRFKNTGSKPLVISNVSATCGCTVPEKPEKPIQPGDIGFIKVKFNSQGRPGMAHKSVNVLSNAEPAFPELLLQGEVIKKDQ